LALNPDIFRRYQQSELLLLGGSAGSFQLIFRIVKNFPAHINKPVIVVIHRKKNFHSDIEKLFSENSRMSLEEISDKMAIRPDTIYVAPANYHTLIEKNRYFGLDVSEAVWFSKPSIDVTFESAAEEYGSTCTAILLSGANQDGAEGLLKLRTKGSLTIVQHPGDAEMVEMPNAAININAAEFILHTSEIYELLENENYVKADPK
jgi:two-component system chemotaxis response regulator CheB